VKITKLFRITINIDEVAEVQPKPAPEVPKQDTGSCVPDAVISETGACLVPLTPGRIAALAGGGQDVTGLDPVNNPDGFDVDGQMGKLPTDDTF
jgi:hypothetical protein